MQSHYNEKYFQRLIKRLIEARVEVPDEIVKDNDEFVKTVLNNTLEELRPPRTIEVWTGIPLSMFPPPVYLNTRQVEQLVKHIVVLWKCFNFIPDFPDDEMSIVHKYELLLSFWQQELQHFSNDMEVVDFCLDFPKDCKLGKHCQCGENWSDRMESLHERLFADRHKN